jgi:hypothetical protein
VTITVATDFDGVLYPFLEALAQWWAETGRPGEVSVDPSEREFWRSMGLTDEEFHVALDEFGEDGGFRTQPPYELALSGLELMFDSGAELVGVTSRAKTKAVAASTFGWVADWFLPLRCILIGPTSKLEAECDLVLDDDPATLDMLEELGEARGLLLDRPWNRHDGHHPRVTWEQMPGIVEGLLTITTGLSDPERTWAIQDAVDLLRGDEEAEEEPDRIT